MTEPSSDQHLTSPDSTLAYRPDVDGLRALAVLLVILFHAGLSFTGGFVGVDVFFVISGFLITGLISKEQAAGKFSMGRFWMRRIRRIAPAALFVTLCSLTAGYFLLLPGDYVELSKSAVAQQFLASNVFFWRSTGYFEDPANTKPLLHTWSLAIEEQFYLAYPFALYFLHRRKFKRTASILTTIAAASLALSIWGVYNYPGATFFLLPTRGWELLLGALTYFASLRRIESRALSEAIAAGGLILILGPAVLLTEASRFPGLNAIPPCLGAALLILSGANSRTTISELLSLKPLVATGLISYSLYLWHWPIMAFCRYWQTSAEFSASLPVILPAIAVAAIATWYFVEQPCRTKFRTIQLRSVVTSYAAIACGLTAFGFLTAYSQGFPSRLPPDVLYFSEAPTKYIFAAEVTLEQVKSGSIPSVGERNQPATAFVWGDSHAKAILPCIEKLAVELNTRVDYSVHSSTAPLLEFNGNRSIYSLREKSPEHAEAVYQHIRDQQIKTIILAADWEIYSGDSTFKQCLKSTIDRLESLGCRVCILL